jgi:hypothetical protein
MVYSGVISSDCTAQVGLLNVRLREASSQPQMATSGAFETICLADLNASLSNYFTRLVFGCPLADAI